MRSHRWFILVLFFLISYSFLNAQSNVLVLQSDFGLKDGAVAAMKGVAMGVSPQLKIFDLTHEIPPYNIWEASYRLKQVVSYWPAGTVFVSIIDPGVGSSRKSVVARTKAGPYFIVTPDNGTLTLLEFTLGIDEVREIDEKLNRLPGSSESYTFHGRDVYAYTGARLAAGRISFEKVGPKLTSNIVKLSFEPASINSGSIRGTIDILDVQYGNLWTNIPGEYLAKAGIVYGNSIDVEIFFNGEKRYEGKMTYGQTFSDVREGEAVAYLNSLLNFSIALNMGDFAATHDIGSGSDWRIELRKAD